MGLEVGLGPPVVQVEGSISSSLPVHIQARRCARGFWLIARGFLLLLDLFVLGLILILLLVLVMVLGVPVLVELRVVVMMMKARM